MAKQIKIDSRQVSKWLQSQVATSNRLKTVLSNTRDLAKQVAIQSNADSIDEVAKQLTELTDSYAKIHGRYVEINNQMLATNKKANAAASFK